MFPQDLRSTWSAIVWSALVLGLSQPGSAQEWTRFRGPNGSGISSPTRIPTVWNKENHLWKVPLPGTGDSSVVLWGNRVFVTSAEEKGSKLYLNCLQMSDGSTLWKKEFALVPYPIHQYNSFATSTPAVDSERVYIAWLTRGHYMLSAFGHSGEKVWEKDLGAFESQHGSGGSPVVIGDLVIFVKDPDADSFILALSSKDGTERWRTPLRGARADYATPCLFQVDGQKPVLVFTSMEDGVLGLDVENGKKAWQIEKVFSQRCVSSPVLVAGLVVGSCGSGGGGNYVAAVRPSAAGPHKSGIAYTIRKAAPYVPTSLAFGDLLFLWSEAGIVTCVHAPTGETRWQERVGGNFFASPVCADGRLFNISTAGEVVILQAADKFQELGRNRLEEGTRATPAISGGRMYVRTFTSLTAIGAAD